MAPTALLPSAEDTVVECIEGRLAGVLEQLIQHVSGTDTDGEDHRPGTADAPAAPPSITLARRRPACRTAPAVATSFSPSRSSCWSWPGRTAHEGWRFAATWRVLGEVHEAIRQGYTASMRDVFYLDPERFGRQAVVERCVDDLARTAGVERAAVHV
ncbi:hypothetical protein KEM52_006160, partial [Ascosphaera acerosa]